MKQIILRLPLRPMLSRSIAAFVLSFGIISSDSNHTYQAPQAITNPNQYVEVQKNLNLNTATLTPLEYALTSQIQWLEGPVVDAKKFAAPVEEESKALASTQETFHSKEKETKEEIENSEDSQTIAIGGPNNPTPSPTPTATPQPTPSTIPQYPMDKSVDSMLSQWASHFGIDESLLRTIGMCESGLNPTSLSRNGLYAGMYQFSSSTWVSTRNQMSHDSNPDLRFHPEEAIKTAAFKIAAGGQSAWTNCLPK